MASRGHQGREWEGPRKLLTDSAHKWHITSTQVLLARQSHNPNLTAREAGKCRRQYLYGERLLAWTLNNSQLCLFPWGEIYLKLSTLCLTLHWEGEWLSFWVHLQEGAKLLGTISLFFSFSGSVSDCREHIFCTAPPCCKFCWSRFPPTHTEVGGLWWSSVLGNGWINPFSSAGWC